MHAMILRQLDRPLEWTELDDRQPGLGQIRVTVLACGLRRDTLRVPPLLGIAHDRRWPKPVRIAACKSLGMIADPASSDGLRTLVHREPDADVKKAAMHAQRRLHASAEAGPA